MTPIQTSAAEYAITLTTQLRHELARLLTLPPPQCDDAAIAMRGAEMTADALVRLLKGNAPVIGVEPIVADLSTEYAELPMTTAAQRAEAFLRTLGKWEES